MNDVMLAVSILWGFLFIYSIVGSIDFGAGFWAMVYGTNRETKAAEIANRFLSPSWKVTNVFLVLLVVALIGFFPKAAFTLAGILVLPVGLVLILLTVRSTFMVYAYSVKRLSRLLSVVSGVTGLLIPGLLVSVLPVSLGGFVVMDEGRPTLALAKLFRSPTEYAHLGFGLSAELFLSALFLADYAREAEDEGAYRIYRRLALMLGPAALAMAILTTLAMPPEAQWIVEGFRRNRLWFVLSAAAFAVGFGALWLKRPDGRVGYPRFAVVAVVIQYAFASLAYGRAHLPYMVHPYLTIDQGVTNATMLRSLLIGYTVSTAVLLPVFYWFWKLFFKDKRYLKPD